MVITTFTKISDIQIAASGKKIHFLQSEIKELLNKIPDSTISAHDVQGRKSKEGAWLRLDMPLFYKEEISTIIQWQAGRKKSELQKHSGIDKAYNIALDILCDEEINNVIQNNIGKAGKHISFESIFYFDEHGNAAKFIDIYDEIDIPKTPMLPDVHIYKSEICIEDLKYITRGLKVMLERLRDYVRVCGDSH